MGPARMIEAPAFTYENMMFTYDKTFDSIESSRSYRENPVRATSERGATPDLCLLVEGIESCGSVDEETRVPSLVLSKGATSPHSPTLARELLRTSKEGCDL